jgi:hypothetical protein
MIASARTRSAGTTMMIGAAAQRRPREQPTTALDYARMRDAGIDWIRLGIRPPFTDETMTTTSAAFQAQEREVETIARHGLKLMAYTPFPGGDPDIGGHYPAWNGPPGSDAYLDHYETVCAWLGERFRGVADAWQIANELNLPFWAGELTPEQAVAFLQRGGRGIRRGNPEARIGFNMAGFGEVAMAMYTSLFAGAEGQDVVEFDYIGCDGYLAPDLWPENLAQLKAITDKPIVVQEFGYASAGITLTAEQTRDHPFTSAHDRCRWRGWMRTWNDHEHTPQEQAEYVARCLAHFLAEPRLIGVFIWRWDDAPRCWLCGRPSATCPGTGRWGLVDEAGNPKPALDAFRAGAARLKHRVSGEEAAGDQRQQA